jgi:hypothetical protein
MKHLGSVTHPKNEFGWLLRDVRLAFRRHDCEGARKIVYDLSKQARTEKQQTTVARLKNAVRACEYRRDTEQGSDLGRGRARARRH